MKQNSALATIFAFFLGLLVLALVAVALMTFLPEPEWSQTSQAARENWQLTTSIVLLGCATALLAASLFLPEVQVVISNGILLGGVFTMVYAVIMAFNGSAGMIRLVVVAVALAVTIAIGYLRFVRGRGAAPATPAGADAASASELGGRVAAIERRLDAVANALSR